MGAGVFDKTETFKNMIAVWPNSVKRIKNEVVSFDPEKNNVNLKDGTTVGYNSLVVAPGLKLDLEAVEGLSEPLGQNEVTSNYRYDLAPLTWELVKKMKGKEAIFTQPGMLIKSAGAPQKAMYLSCDHWKKHGRLKNVSVSFCNAGPVFLSRNLCASTYGICQ